MLQRFGKTAAGDLCLRVSTRGCYVILGRLDVGVSWTWWRSPRFIRDYSCWRATGGPFDVMWVRNTRC